MYVYIYVCMVISIYVHCLSVLFVGWPWIDALGDEVCVPPSEDGVFFPGKPLPIFLHYCQFFRAAEIGFQKRRVRKGLFECAQPMMMKLPRNLGKTTYKNRDGDVRVVFFIAICITYY